MGAHELVARHVAAALEEGQSRCIARDVIARCLLSEAIRLFREGRSIADIADELNAAADNLDDDEPLAFMRP
jgi:hypothetical protein